LDGATTTKKIASLPARLCYFNSFISSSPEDVVAAAAVDVLEMHC
jgi:hypothetical protein